MLSSFEYTNELACYFRYALGMQNAKRYCQIASKNSLYYLILVTALLTTRFSLLYLALINSSPCSDSCSINYSRFS